MVISKLKPITSKNPKIVAIERRILGLLRTDLPISMHNHIKALWYKKRIEKVLKGNYKSVSPVNVEFVPSLDCNLKCPPCTYRTWKADTNNDQGKRKTNYENMVILLDNIEDAGVKGVTFTGGGEPFANPHTIEGLEYAATKKFDTGVFTNGTLLNPQIIGGMAQLDISFIRISFNSGERSNYLRFHGINNPGIFETVKKNIILLGKALASSGTLFGIAVIVNEVNVDYMATVAEFVRNIYDTEKDFKIDYITFRPVLNYGQISSDPEKQISPEVAQRALERFEQVKNILHGLPISLMIAEDYFIAASKATKKLERGYDTCIGHTWCGSIAYDGGVYLCSERNGDPDYLMGNLLKSSLTKIWKSKQRENVLKKIKGCPPACKIHRTNILLHSLTQAGKLKPDEIKELQEFLDIIRNAGKPLLSGFLSY